MADDVIDQMLKELNKNSPNMSLNSSSGTLDNFEAAGKAFIYLVFCPSEKTRYLSRQVLKYNVTEILNNIKQIWEEDKDFFEILEKRFDFKFRNILRIREGFKKNKRKIREFSLRGFLSFWAPFTNFLKSLNMV